MHGIDTYEDKVTDWKKERLPIRLPNKWIIFNKFKQFSEMTYLEVIV